VCVVLVVWLLRSRVAGMPTDLRTPKCNATVNRLVLGVTSARGSGTEPAFPAPGMCACFESE